MELMPLTKIFARDIGIICFAKCFHKFRYSVVLLIFQQAEKKEKKVTLTLRQTFKSE